MLVVSVPHDNARGLSAHDNARGPVPHDNARGLSAIRRAG